VKTTFRMVVMFLIGFCSYITIEVLYRGFSYPLMGCMGGIVFILIDQINEIYSWDIELLWQSVLGGIYATALEFVFGLVDRYVLYQHMWDYSHEFGNVLGIICVKFSIYWCFLALLAVFVADFVNYCMYRHSQIPYYIIAGRKWEPGIYKILD